MIVFSVVMSAPPRPNVEWTFDDGPHYKMTPQIVRELACYGIKGTFYIVGSRLLSSRNRAALRDVVKAGHRLGNHLWTHRDPCHDLSPSGVLRELRRTRRALERMFGKGIDGRRYRPPHGSTCRAVWRVVRREGYATRMWHIADWRTSARRMWYVLSSRARRGKRTVLLFHYSMKKLRYVLRRAAAAGYINKRRCAP